MAYVQYTTCENPANHWQMNQYIQGFIYAGPFAVIAGIAVAASGHLVCGLIAFQVSGFLYLLAYCNWWLHHRLLCLPARNTPVEEAAVGMLVSVEPPPKPFPESWDTDYSINLLLPGTQLGVSQGDAEASAPYGVLITEQAGTDAEGLPYKGYRSRNSAVLHAEFEGGGVYYLEMATMIALPIAVVALIACLADGPVGFLVAFILAVLAWLFGGAGAGLALNSEGSPSDVGLPALHTSDSSTPDVLGVAGHWVYDAGHNNEDDGWNELHPCTMGEVLGTWTGDWGQIDVNGTPTPVGQLVIDWERQVDATIAARGSTLGVDHWRYHPDVDGCDEDKDGDDDEPVVVH